MPEGESSHRDLISIEIRGEEAKDILAELRALFTSLQETITTTGASIDTTIGQLVQPLSAITELSSMAVIELMHLRQELAGIGAVAAAPRAAAASVREVGRAAKEARFQTTAHREELMGGLYPEAEQPMLWGMPPAGPTPYTPPAPPEPDVMDLWATQARAAQVQAQAPLVMGPRPWAREPEAGKLEQVRQRLLGISEASDTADKSYGRFSGSFRRHIVWFAQGTIIYYAISSAIGAVTEQLSGGVRTLLEYDRAMAHMRYITGEGLTTLDELAQSAVDIGTAFGQMPEETLPALVQITQASKDQGEQLIYTRDASRMALMANMEMGDSLESLIAIERVWNMEASEGQHILDTVATSYRVAKIPMEEMLATLVKGGRIAGSVGLTFDEYAATIAAVGEYSNLTASQVTTLMEAVAARPFQPALAQRFEREFGFLDIPLFEPGTAGRERRAVSDILDDLILQWDRLSSAQKQSAAEVMVGRRLASEFLTLMEAWKHIPDYVDEYNDSLGESNKLLEQQMSTAQVQGQIAAASWAELRGEIALTLEDLFSVRDTLMDIAAVFGVLGDMAARARGGRGPEATAREQLEARIADAQMALAEVRGEYGIARQLRRRVGGYVGMISVTDPEQYMEDVIRQYQQQLEAMGPAAGAEERGGLDLMGEYRTAQQEAARFAQAQFSEEMVARQRWAEWQVGGGIDFEQWIQGFDAVTTVMDYTEFTQEQINQAQQESVDLVDEMVQAYLLRAAILKGEALTWQEINAIMEEVYLWANAQVEVYRDASGQLQVIAGQEAAFLDTQLQALEAEKARFDIQRLRDIQPGQFGALQQGAAQWQGYLQTLPGYDEEARQFYVVLADNVARPIVTTATALRYAIEDLTEVERRQLEGMWNLPAGVTAYVPITSLFYQRQQEVGPGGGAGGGAAAGFIDTTPVSMAVVSLSSDLMMAGDAATAFAQLMFYAQSTLQAREQALQASVLTPDRRRAVEDVFQKPWSQVFEEEIGYTPWKAVGAETLQGVIREEYGATPAISANINLSSNLYLNETLLAQTLQQVQGARLGRAARGYGNRAGGNAPPVMV